MSRHLITSHTDTCTRRGASGKAEVSQNGYACRADPSFFQSKVQELKRNEENWFVSIRVSQEQHEWHFGSDNSLWGQPMQCRLFGRLPGLSSLDFSSKLPPSLFWQPNMFPDHAKHLLVGEAKFPQLRTPGLWEAGSIWSGFPSDHWVRKHKLNHGPMSRGSTIRFY